MKQLAIKIVLVSKTLKFFSTDEKLSLNLHEAITLSNFILKIRLLSIGQKE